MALNITRNTGQSILIINEETGEEITVQLISTQGKQSRIALEAPSKYFIIREELNRKE